MSDLTAFSESTCSLVMPRILAKCWSSIGSKVVLSMVISHLGSRGVLRIGDLLNLFQGGLCLFER